MNHPNHEEWMSFIYGELPPETHAEQARHFESCAACRAQVTAWRSTMVELGFVDEELLWKGLARQTGLARVDLATLQVSVALVQRVPMDLCEKHGVFPVAYQDQTKALTV